MRAALRPDGDAIVVEPARARAGGDGGRLRADSDCRSGARRRRGDPCRMARHLRASGAGGDRGDGAPVRHRPRGRRSPLSARVLARTTTRSATSLIDAFVDGRPLARSISIAGSFARRWSRSRISISGPRTPINSQPRACGAITSLSAGSAPWPTLPSSSRTGWMANVPAAWPDSSSCRRQLEFPASIVRSRAVHFGMGDSAGVSAPLGGLARLGGHRQGIVTGERFVIARLRSVLTSTHAGGQALWRFHVANLYEGSARAGRRSPPPPTSSATAAKSSSPSSRDSAARGRPAPARCSVSAATRTSGAQARRCSKS